MSERFRVRIPSGYPKPFCFDLGQRNACFVEGPLVRGSRILPWMDSLTFVRGPDCDLMHTLNAVPILRRRPYLITFESYLPRVPDDRHSQWLERFLFKFLVRPNCRRLIAFSDYALGQFKTQIARYDPYESLLDKTEKLYPAVEPRADGPRKLSGHALNLLFVGRQFMHKGGPAVVKAAEILNRRGVRTHTTVVSTLQWDGAGLVGPNPTSETRTLASCVRSSDIKLVQKLSNAEILRLMDEADFLLLPTVNDTFGFACIEAMAGGTPVIATKTCAIPEIIENERNGFLLDMPIDEHGRWRGLAKRRAKDYNRLYFELIEDLGEQIARRISEVCSDPAIYPKLSAGAVATVDAKFNREAARNRLENIYEDALR